MKFTIITVCFNAALVIEKTVRSVLNQNFSDYEYLIIDGGSKDGTLNVLDKYKTNSLIKIVSEPDTGIYNAMNKGISMAKGDYIYFLNANDDLFDNEVLGKLSSVLAEKAVYYGTIRKKSVTGDIKTEELITDAKEFKERVIQGWMPCHQSVLAPIEFLRNHYFNEKYEIRADFEWVVWCVSQKLRFLPIEDLVIANFDNKGISSSMSSMELVANETSEILNDYHDKLLGEADENVDIIRNLQYKNSKLTVRYDKLLRLLPTWFDDSVNDKIFQKLGAYSSIAIYGAGVIGKEMEKTLMKCGLSITCFLDRNAKCLSMNTPVFCLQDRLPFVDAVIISLLIDEEEIESEIKCSLECKIFRLTDLLCDSDC